MMRWKLKKKSHFEIEMCLLQICINKMMANDGLAGLANWISRPKIIKIHSQTSYETSKWTNTLWNYRRLFLRVYKWNSTESRWSALKWVNSV